MIPGPDVHTISQTISQAPQAPGVGSSAAMDGLGQLTLAMVVVVGMIFACFWVVKRLNNGTGLAKKHMKVVSSSMVGAKERVVIVEVKDTWLVLGVGNGNVNKLHELPKPEDELPGTTTPTATFGAKLSELISKNRQ